MDNFLINKTNIFIIDALIAIICFAGIFQLTLKAGIDAQFYDSREGIIITDIKNESEINKIKNGDIILSINEIKISTIEDIEFILDQYAIGQQVTYLVERNGQKITLPIILERYNTTTYLITLLIVGHLFLIMGIFVLKKRPSNDMIALIFHWMSIAVSVHICTTFGRYTIFPMVIGYTLRIIFLLASALTPILFLHFSFIFPRKKWPEYYKFIRGLYIIFFLYFVYMAYSFINAVEPVSIKSFHQFLHIYNFGRLLFISCMIFGVVNIINSYRKAVEESERRKLRWVILGLAIAPLNFIILWQIPHIISSVPLVRGEVILLSSAVVPLTFSISIVRYHILNIDYIFNRSTVYVLVLTIILFIYSGIVATAAVFIGIFTIRSSIIVSAVAAIIVALLFEPSRRAVQRFVDKKFFRVRYNYRIAQREFTSEINGYIDLASLAEFVINKLDALLQPERIAFFTFGDSSTQWKLAAGRNLDFLQPGLKRTLTAYTNRSLNPLMAIPAYIEPGISFEKANEKAFRSSHIVLVMPLWLQPAQNSGFLILGHKKSDTMFSLEDIDLLKTVVSQTTSAIERIHLQQDLLIQHEETERLEELNKLKSYFVSSVSHDLQTPLTSIKMFAELLQTKTNISKNDKQEYLDIIQGESDRLSRLINNVLSFSRIERGTKEYKLAQVNLGSIAKNVLRTMKYQIEQNGFELEIQLPDNDIIINVDMDSIAEALTNLIDNAIKYSQKQKSIALSVFRDEDCAVIQVKDNGIGISEKDQKKIFSAFFRSADKKIQALGGAGLGLTQVSHIAEAHNGRIMVKSKPGSGSTFSLFLPLGETK